MNDIIRIIRGYEINGDKEKVALALDPNVPLEYLQKTFGESSNNPMYDCYQIKKRHAESLKPFLFEDLDFNSFNFYLECDSTIGDNTN